jgi:hypothetical protein
MLDRGAISAFPGKELIAVWVAEAVHKIVRFRILFTKRNYEYAFPAREDLMAEDLSMVAFSAWKLQEFIQSLAERRTPVPERWRSAYPPDERDREGRPLYRDQGMLLGIPEEDRKYLQVFCEVLENQAQE